MEDVSLKVVRDPGPDIDASVRGPGDVVTVASELLEDADREHMLVFFLDTKQRVTGYHTVSIGTLNASLVSAREVFKAALLANAARIILVHNHPSGDPAPSSEDRGVTREIREAGDLMDVPLLDHIVIGANGRHISIRTTDPEIFGVSAS